MKKLAIFGDSNASYNIEGFFQNPSCYWQSILAEKLGVDFDCFGLNGSNLYYSYNKLKSLKNLNEYQYVVFIETAPGRLSIGENAKNDLFFISNNSKVHYDIMSYRSSFYYDIIEAGEKYFKFLRQENFDQDVHNLLVKEIYNILSTANKIFVIQPLSLVNYTNITKPKYPTDVNFFLLDIISKQYSTIPRKKFEKYHVGNERLANHLTPRNNQLIADYYFDLLTSGKSNIYIDNFETFYEPLEQWFRI
jgi:hypothetical protein